MVLKVEDKEQFEETKPILGSTGTSENDETDLKIQEVYKNLTRSMKADPLTIDKPIVALDLFSTAVKVQNITLAKQCIEILNNHLSKRNVLLIMQRLSACRSQTYPDPYDIEPSAPPIIEDDFQRTEDWVHDLIDNLRNNCLLEIDKNADYVLKQKEVLELCYGDVLSITTRDTLQVSSEMCVYSAVMRWCIEECKRRTLQIQTINLKAVLRELTYAPRYGLMSKKEFLCRTIDGVKGPDRSGILDEDETERILEAIKRRGKIPQGEELPFKGSVPRRAGHEKPWHFHSGERHPRAVDWRSIPGTPPFNPYGRPTPIPVIPNYRPKREIDLKEQDELVRLPRSNGRPYLPRPTPRPNYRSRRETDDEEDALVRLPRSNGRPYLPRPTSRPVIPNYRPKREADEEYLEELVRLPRSNGRPYLPRPTPRPNYRSRRETDDEEDALVRLPRSNSRPYLPRPTSRPVIPNYRPKREADEEYLEELVRLPRSNGRPYLPRPTPRPNYRSRRETDDEEDALVRLPRSNGRPYLPRPTSRPVIPNYRPKREADEEYLEELVRLPRSNGRPYLPRPTPRPNYRSRREIDDEEDALVRLPRSNGRPYLPRPTSRPVIPNYRPKREADEEYLEELVRLPRADTRPRIPRPTIRPV